MTAIQEDELELENWKKTCQFKVDSDLCIWCWACVAITSDYELMDFDRQWKAEFIKQPENDDEIQAAEETISACPVEAIICS
jgi:ferredoxin